MRFLEESMLYFLFIHIYNIQDHITLPPTEYINQMVPVSDILLQMYSEID